MSDVVVLRERTTVIVDRGQQYPVVIAGGPVMVTGGGGGGGAAAWGGITGTLGDQADLQAALDAKSDDGHGHAIADVSGLQAALDAKAAASATINAQAGTSYTLVLGDAGDVVQLTNAAAITLTIPPNSSAAFPVGTVIEIHQGGAGTVTVAGDTGVTLASRGSVFDLAGQDAIAAIRKVATDTWRLTGDIA